MTIQQQYGRARETFVQFKAGLESNEDLRNELLGALALLLTERSTSFYENRFITGGAAEYIIAAAMRCVGLSDVRTVGFEDVRVDVTVGGHGFSVKSVFTPNGTIALINTLGEGENIEWVSPTIILLSNGYSRGIGYVDPELLPPDVTKRTRDRITLPRTPVNVLFRTQPEYLLRCDVPANPGKPDLPSQILTAISLTTGNN